MTVIEFSKQERRAIVLAVSVGNLLEWYEIYLYVYWAPIISKLFFHCSSDLMGLIYTYLIFGLGFLARPLGGVFFGRLGDKIGRKKSMILSLVIMIFPTFITGLLPTFKQIGHFAPCILALMRILQAFPAGGELPGAICYLYESARPNNRKYLSSWSAVGFQMGIFLSTLECFFLERYLPTKDLLDWGWRVSFLVGGLIGLLGLFLRCKLHETPLFQEMLKHEKVIREPLFSVFKKNRANLFKAGFFCVLNSASFYLITVNFPMYFSQMFSSNARLGLVVTSVILLIITIPLPFFGALAQKVDYKKILIYSTIGSIILLFPLYLAMNSASLLLMSITVVLFSLLFSCISALIPYALCDVFPTYSRFTCVGVSFNVVDAIVGGFTPAIALVLLRTTGNRGSICWFLLVCALISLISFLKITQNPAGRVENV